MVKLAGMWKGIGRGGGWWWGAYGVVPLGQV